MNKADLKKAVAADTNITQKEAGIVIDSVLDNIKKGVVETGKVTLVGFGSLVVREAKARKARNPRTGEAIDVPAKRVVKFNVAKAFKEAALEGALPGEADATDDE